MRLNRRKPEHVVLLWSFSDAQMEELSSEVGIPMNCIFPVKNYHEEIDLNEDVDTLILSALKHIIEFGDDFIEKLNIQVKNQE